MRADQFVTGYVSQDVKVESKFTDYELAVMEGGLSLDKPKSALHQAVTEAFDQPYKILRWENSEHYGDVDAIARLDDNTFLSIMFNMEYDEEGEEVIQVEFHRNNSQEVTGDGDAQRVFATVLAAIQQYIKEHNPKRLTFSASKEVEPDQNRESRAKLYDRLVQRYARTWGYRPFRADTGSIVRYELSRIKPIPPVKENFVNYQGLRPPKNVPGTNLFPGQDIVGQRVYHCTNRLEAIKKSGGLKPLRDATGEREYGRLSTDEHPFIPVIGIWFSVGKPDWPGKHCVSFVIEPTDQVYVAYANTKGLKPNVVLNPIALDRLTVEGQQDVAENFADGKVKGKSRPGRVKRSGASCDGSVSDLRSKAKDASGERAKMYHWCANMKSGRAKNESEMLEDLNVIWKDVLEAGVYKGYPCTKDCSGHAAGDRWADARNITDPNQCPYSNNSFWEGCLAHTDEQE